MDNVTATRAPLLVTAAPSFGICVRWAAPVAVAAVLGFVWGAETLWVAFAPGVFAVWWWAKSRRQVFAVGLAYHLIAARSLIVGAERYFALSPVVATLCIAVGAAVVGGVWSLWWSSRGREEHAAVASARLAGLWLTTYLPGVGAIAVGTPLCAAGVWLPGTGWLGLAVLFAVSVAARRLVGVAVMIALSAVGAARWTSPGSSPIAAVRTEVAPSRSVDDFEQQWHVANVSMEAAQAAVRSRIVALPEGAAGLWHAPMQRLWEPLRAAPGRFVIAGAVVDRADGRFDNVALILGDDRVEIYVQRAPIPFAMWSPGSLSGFAAHWLGRGTVEVGGRRLGVAICWEAAIAWPLLQSVVEGADILVVLANTAWLPPAALRALEQGVQSWGALFGLPVAVSANVYP